MTDAERARQGETIPPEFQAGAFHCVYCAVYTRQNWLRLSVLIGTGATAQAYPRPIWECTCSNCLETSYWYASSSNPSQGLLVVPHRSSLAPHPHPDMPSELRADYEEAASIVQLSPRGAAALLRLVLQKLMPLLGEKGKNINEDIKSLVSKGLDPSIQQALDALRVVGNSAVHPGELDLQDDGQVVASLFGLINYIVEQRISHPKKLADLYEGLPQGARSAIEERDGAS